MIKEPYASARRVFWIVDNGSSHRGDAATERLHQVDSRIILLHTPVHASWLNQIEIYFSIVQRKADMANDVDETVSQLPIKPKKAKKEAPPLPRSMADIL